MKTEEEAAMPLAGGILQHGYQCGMIWGAALAAGRQAYNQYGSTSEAEAEAVLAAQKLVESFRSLNRSINCAEITELDKSSTAMDMVKFFLLKGGVVSCFRRVAKYAPVALDEIELSLSQKASQMRSSPISCTSVLARKMGASDMHAVMVAGFAGGIGLCGGGCGALGAAIWITSVKNQQKQGSKPDFRDSSVKALLEKFLQLTDYKFECSEIAGRTFATLDEHASYVKSGGCAQLLDALATT